MAVETPLGVQVGHSFGRVVGLRRAVLVQTSQRDGLGGVAVMIQLLAVESRVHVATNFRNIVAVAADEVVEQRRLRLRLLLVPSQDRCDLSKLFLDDFIGTSSIVAVGWDEEIVEYDDRSVIGGCILAAASTQCRSGSQVMRSQRRGDGDGRLVPVEVHAKEQRHDNSASPGRQGSMESLDVRPHGHRTDREAHGLLVHCLWGSEVLWSLAVSFFSCFTLLLEAGQTGQPPGRRGWFAFR